MVHIPYGKTFIDFDETGASVLTSRIGELKAEGSGSDIVKKAMADPIDSPRLSELARGKKTCTIIISDHTRPVPSRDILPNMDKAYAKCTEFQGQVSGEHSIGHAKKRYLKESVGDTAYGLMYSIKKVFDPDLILNPGKVCNDI